MLNIQV